MRWQDVRRCRIEAPSHATPGDYAVGDYDQEGARRAVFDPPLRFFRYPGRMRRSGRCQIQKELGLAERALDRCPETGAGREVGLVAEYAHRAQAVPGLGNAMKGALQ